MSLSVRARHRWILACSLACAAPVTHVAHAQDRGIDEGRTRFTRGIELYKEGNFHAALAEFRAAYAAAPSFRIHYNLGQTLYQLQDYAGAMRAFEQYLAEGGDKIDGERRKEIEDDLVKLRSRTAKVTFAVNVSPAEISIDDEPRGMVQQQPLLVSAGRRRISVTASGYQTETRVLDVAGAQELELKFELKPIVTEVLLPPSSQTQSTIPAHRQKSRTPFYVGLVTTGVLAGGTAVMAAVTSSNHSAYEKALEVPNNKPDIDDARRATRTTALAGDILGGATILAAGLTVFAFAMTSGEEPPQAAKAPPTKPTIRAVFAPNAAGVTGTF
ncbi:Thiol-disulfide isomerase and thioredoxin [Labilithrix luteola]|uniref:Thiol-disulfide isomerase and thioredoxin n=1 Tax=Labilithrix luteola TaxID=1391654 RepID=A0A0K1QDP4_9BACT|nr:tetratricopeptide repeat protein [Labilithrix luteola]AKV03555.1 Thiol-disulfide isomerase and thioredoxin [Labilithrix luteola]